MAGERRVALVIGNGGYKHAPSLMNPKRDARAISAILKKLDFEVVEGFDLDLYNTADVQDQFERRLKGADVSLLFYAGHGLQVEGKNYLVPVDAEISTLTHLNFRTVPFDILLSAMNRHTPASLVFLDACRDNPFTRSLLRSLTGPTRDMMAIRGGLAEMEKVEGTFIAYATAPNTVAYDGTGSNSPFTTALLEHIETPGLSVSDMMIDVRNKVLDMTNRKQVPWEQSSLNSKFYFVEQEDITPDPVQSHASAVWQAIQNSNSAAVISKFKATYPEPPWSVFADARLEELRKLDDERRERQEKQRSRENELLLKKTESHFKTPIKYNWNRLGYSSIILVIISLLVTLYLEVTPPKSPVTFSIGLSGQKKITSIVPGSKASFQDAPFAPKMVVVPKWRYTRGSKYYSDEQPKQTVTFSSPFAVGQFEVTFDEWDACVADGGCDGYKPDDHGWGRGKRPVINVSWNDAQTYIKWLNTKVSGAANSPYRLLSENEWEYVARAGSTSGYFFGDKFSELCQYANGADKSTDYREKNKSCNDGIGKQTAPVGSYLSNKFGLYDVHGNVWEWVRDHYHNSYKGSPADGSAWENKGDSSTPRVLRGGSWNNGFQALRSAKRNSEAPARRYSNIGFRVARTLSPLNF